MNKKSEEVEEKIRFTLWVKSSTMEEAKSLMTVADCKKTSEFIEKAIEFYCGYLRNSTDDYVPEIVLSTLRGLMNENENRHNGSLFRIDRKIGGTDTEMPEAPDEPKETQTSEVEENFEPYKPKIRKSGTGCVYQINDTLWEGSFYPRLPNGKRKKFNVYAKTRKECEKKLAKMITEKKKRDSKTKSSYEKIRGLTVSQSSFFIMKRWIYRFPRKKHLKMRKNR